MTFPGHLRARKTIPQQALFLLLRQYDKYEPFVQHCEEMKPEFDRLHGVPLSFSRERQLAEIAARCWNLDQVPEIREFNYRRLRNAIRQTGEKVGNVVLEPFCAMAFAGRVPEEPTVAYGGRIWEWSLDSGESLGGLRKRVMFDLGLKRASYLPDEVVQQLKVMPEEARRLNWQLGDMQHGLKQTVEWLFLRLCPQPDAPLSFARIALREEQKRGQDTDSETMIRRAVTGLARRMNIQLPPLKRGRPREKPLHPFEHGCTPNSPLFAG
ncbi:MAG: hypothetical protein A2Y74_01315 [Actinobacteria bacterium RBG_13_63_9]|nr:MAG: hypothetical protein A2Y74_01315 [Actinobacteria bacterium RBG_13_63_9]